MPRFLIAAIASACLAGCGQADAGGAPANDGEYVKDYRESDVSELTVHAPREKVFDAVFGAKAMKHQGTLVSNNGSEQIYEAVIDSQTPGWEEMTEGPAPFATTHKETMELSDRRTAKLRFNINDGEVRGGITWRFEDTASGGTSISYQILPLASTRTEDLSELRQATKRKAGELLERLSGLFESGAATTEVLETEVIG